jgi:predicted RNA-binding protein with PUA-like domain
MPKRARHYWLMKSEPDVYGIDDLERDGQAEWDGVRNYQARNYMRDAMAVGDLVLFYHSNAKPPGVAGVAEVATEAYPDPTQFDPDSKYFDPKATAENPRWHLVDVAFVEKFSEILPLQTLKDHAEALDGMMVIQRGVRFSVQPVEKDHFKAVLKLAGAKTRVR